MTDTRNTLENYIGQQDVKSNLQILIASAKQRGMPLDHVLFHGGPGLGKTHLSQLIAEEMGADLTCTIAPAINTPADMIAIILKMERGGILFIDEIHSLNRRTEELLYTSMESHLIDVVFGENYPQSIRIALPPFTVIGATTRLAHVTEPLRARFGSSFKLNYYETHDLATILTRDACNESINALPDGVDEIASRSRGTPRIALKLLRRARDYALAFRAELDANTASAALDALGIDAKGLNADDRRYLNALCDKKVPTGVESLASMLNEEVDTLEDVIEPFLLYKGLMERTSRGRIATFAGYVHLNRGNEFADMAKRGLE